LNNQTRSYGSTIANPNLTPETVTGWEIGGDFKDHALKFGITYFANTLSNMIATSAYTASTGYPQPVLNLCSTNGSNVVNCAVNGTVNYYTNNQNGQANGLELTGKWAVNRQWMVDSFYTYTHSYLTGTWNNVTTPLNTQLTGIPRSSASLAVTWLPTSKLRVYLQTYYIGPMSYQQTGNTSGAVLANYVQPGNSILNGSINYAYDRSTDLYFNATNLLNHVYQEGTYQASMPQAMSLSPPRTVMAGLRYRF
jgi:iron complex outermembrane receptor protein